MKQVRVEKMDAKAKTSWFWLQDLSQRFREVYGLGVELSVYCLRLRLDVWFGVGFKVLQTQIPTY